MDTHSNRLSAIKTRLRWLGKKLNIGSQPFSRIAKLCIETRSADCKTQNWFETSYLNSGNFRLVHVFDISRRRPTLCSHSEVSINGLTSSLRGAAWCTIRVQFGPVMRRERDANVIPRWVAGWPSPNSVRNGSENNLDLGGSSHWICLRACSKIY